MEDRYIDKVTISATTKCNKDFSCLNGPCDNLCSVAYSMNQGIAFVRCAEGLICNYRTSYGDSYICLCPVRNEIYNKYSI
jgi:hypothetical protein